MTATLRGLEGKNVLVTGAAKGLGYGIVMDFADAGCDIAAMDLAGPATGIYELASPDLLAETAATVVEKGRRCIPLQSDIRDESQVQEAVARALDFFDGRIDVLVNVAGVAAFDSIVDMRSETLHAVIDTNIKGTMFMAKYVVPGMIERASGNIVNMSSGTTKTGMSNVSHYVPSKWAVNGLTVCWANELAEYGINVNAVAPAAIKPSGGHGSGMVTGFSKALDMSADEAFEVISAANNLPGKKWRTEVSDVSDAVLFLASDNASQITGHILYVDGGQSAK
ncbi:SDR family NAD(P)-dependent oxidoreductase [Nocardia sp. NPDC059239]|uniref:SDR family NAD(P)-dependent oxidoreductase n=1 Tax=unclassified Nocardia TaxID=2637762 RepID=UPI0036BD9ACC